MKKFILKSSVFVLPFFCVYMLSLQFGTKTKGDLFRIGYLIDNTSNYREIFVSQFTKTRKFKYVSETKSAQKSKFSVLTIGDSFSQQSVFGYQNYLADSNISVTHFNAPVNAIEYMYSILNGDLLEKIDVDFIILESVQRDVLNSIDYLDTTLVVTYNNMIKIENETKANLLNKNSEKHSNPLFTNAIIKFPLFNFLYFFDDNAFGSSVYKVATNDSYFSVDKNELVFFDEELTNIQHAKNKEKLEKLNALLNQLASKLEKKGIKLIVLIAPDKYDVYYNRIANQEAYPKPVFFENFQTLPKKYEYVKATSALQKATQHQKDVYFYDDTHWSPFGSEIIANELKNSIQKK